MRTEYIRLRMPRRGVKAGLIKSDESQLGEGRGRGEIVLPVSQLAFFIWRKNPTFAPDLQVLATFTTPCIPDSTVSLFPALLFDLRGVRQYVEN